MVLALGGCESGPPPGTVGYVQGFGGVVAVDEPRAAVVGRDVLSAGGTAFDAATAIAFALTVTLPDAAGLGGGGVCLVHERDDEERESRVEALDFLPTAPGGTGFRPMSAGGVVDAGASPVPGQPVAVPALVRGLYALHARGGALRWESAVMPAETMARFGVPVSRALATEVAALGGPPADPSMQAIYGAGPVTEGQPMQNRDLARALAVVRTKPGDLYGGIHARHLAQAAQGIGQDLTVEAMRDWRPIWRPAILREAGYDIDAFSPVPDSAQHLADDWRAAAEGDNDRPGDLPPPLPDLATILGSRGGTGFVVADRLGNAVSCALTLNRPFGSGRMLPGFGFPLVPMPGPDSPALAVMLRYNENLADSRAAVAAAGAGAVPLVVAAGVPVIEERAPVAEALSGLAEGGPGKALVTLFACPDGTTGDSSTCQVGVDPRGAGFGLLVGKP